MTRVINLSDQERLASALAGAALALLGARERSFGGAILSATGSALLARGATGYCPAVAVMGRTTEGRSLARASLEGSRGVLVAESVTIRRTPEDLYQRWRALGDLPKVMSHLVEVRVLDAARSHWTAKGPAGVTVEWDAEIINEVPNALLAWRSVEGAAVVSAGSVKFVWRPEKGETEIHVRLQYAPPAGKAGAAAAWLLGRAPSQTIREDLRRFKSVMEAGESPTTKGQSSGRRLTFGRLVEVLS